MAGFVQKIKNMWSPPDDEYDEYYEEDDREEDEDITPIETRDRETSRHSLPLPPGIRSSIFTQRLSFRLCSSSLRICRGDARHCGRAFENAHGSAESGKYGKGCFPPHYRFLSGVAYANGGKIKRVATNTYIIIPTMWI